MTIGRKNDDDVDGNREEDDDDVDGNDDHAEDEYVPFSRSCLKNCIVNLSTYFATNDDDEYDNDHDDDDDVDLDDNDVVKASGV